jgi:CheY-like chemotaxis protein
MNILLAEDLQGNGPNLQYALALAGHRVARAASTSEALELLRNQDFPVLVTHGDSQRLDGFDLCRQVRSHAQVGYTILLATSGQADLPQAFNGPEVDDVLAYPFDGQTLRTRLRMAERLLLLHAQMERILGPSCVCPPCDGPYRGQGLWQRVEAYLDQQILGGPSPVQCPKCLKRMVAEQ